MNVTLICVCLYALLLTSVEPKAKLDSQTRFALAKAHYERVVWKVMCGVPQPRVFRMETTELRVVPPATILHRCGDSTGCCDFATEKCVPKKKEQERRSLGTVTPYSSAENWADLRICKILEYSFMP